MVSPAKGQGENNGPGGQQKPDLGGVDPAGRDLAGRHFRAAQLGGQMLNPQCQMDSPLNWPAPFASSMAAFQLPTQNPNRRPFLHFWGRRPLLSSSSRPFASSFAARTFGDGKGDGWL